MDVRIGFHQLIQPMLNLELSLFHLRFEKANHMQWNLLQDKS
jgi:hypothetical protein